MRVPSGSFVYISIDIDGLDPSIAPGTGTPSHGGFLYYEVKDDLGMERQLEELSHLEREQVTQQRSDGL